MLTWEYSDCSLSTIDVSCIQFQNNCIKASSTAHTFLCLFLWNRFWTLTVILTIHQRNSILYIFYKIDIVTCKKKNNIYSMKHAKYYLSIIFKKLNNYSCQCCKSHAQIILSGYDESVYFCRINMSSQEIDIPIKLENRSGRECRSHQWIQPIDGWMGINRSAGNTSSWETRAWDAHRGWCAGVCGTRGSTPLSRDIEAVTRSLHVNHISVHANTHRLFTHWRL